MRPSRSGPSWTNQTAIESVPDSTTSARAEEYDRRQEDSRHGERVGEEDRRDPAADPPEAVGEAGREDRDTARRQHGNDTAGDEAPGRDKPDDRRQRPPEEDKQEDHPEETEPFGGDVDTAALESDAVADQHERVDEPDHRDADRAPQSVEDGLRAAVGGPLAEYRVLGPALTGIDELHPGFVETDQVDLYCAGESLLGGHIRG